MLSRTEVFALIEGEREYQEKRWPDHTHGVAEYLSYMHDYLQEAIHVDARVDAYSVSHEPAKAAMRKFAALGVACMEQNGLMFRTSRWRYYRGDALTLEPPDNQDPNVEMTRALPEKFVGRHLTFRPGCEFLRRCHIYEAINEERGHQDKIWGDTWRPFSMELTMLRALMRDADWDWTHEDGDCSALDTLRKIVAVAVRCMENNGAPKRERQS